MERGCPVMHFGLTYKRILLHEWLFLIALKQRMNALV